MERRARRVKTKHDRVFTIFVKRMKLNLLLQVYLPFVEEPAFRFRRAMLVLSTCMFVLSEHAHAKFLRVEIGTETRFQQPGMLC